MAGDEQFFTPEQAAKLKRLFAAALMRLPNNPFAAAREVETRTGAIGWIANKWPDDTEVQFYRQEMLAMRGPLSQVPTKEEFAATVYRDIPELKDAKEKLAYMRFFAEIMGFIDNGKNNVNVNVGGVGAGKVMAVPVAASDEEWEAAAKSHYKQLVSRHG